MVVVFNKHRLVNNQYVKLLLDQLMEKIMKTTSKLGMISLLGLLQLLLLTQLVTAGIVDHSDTYVASVHDHYSDDSSLNVLLQDGTVWELHQLPPSWTQHAVIFEPPFPVDDISWWGMESLITTDGQIWVLDGPDPYGEWVQSRQQLSKPVQSHNNDSIYYHPAWTCYSGSVQSPW